ncbi:conserved protein, unknown function [Hepatocystis sp. ex Piliocolobus tephrosceles]|nr:conserved protein, unknown function [Hepatocystis sp. ex Piliocolobus tephrosceles]
MSESSSKILKARIQGIKPSDVELFKSSLMPFNAEVEEYDSQNESAVVNFLAGIENNHLKGLGNYSVEPITYETVEPKPQSLRKRSSKLICDRVVVDDLDIINFFLNKRLITPIIFVLLSLLILGSIF